MFFLAMQTKGPNPRPAAGVTEEEFIDFLKRARLAFFNKVKQDPVALQTWRDALGPLPRSAAQRARFEVGPRPPKGWRDAWYPIWSFDNPNIHGGLSALSVLEAMEWNEADIFPLPARSSDIHKVIEHTHARLTEAFHKWHYNDRRLHSLRRYKVVHEEFFYTNPAVASADVIMGDVKGLTTTLLEIAKAKGGEIRKKYR